MEDANQQSLERFAPISSLGHYIVICGYDAVTDEFEIRDPASSRAFGEQLPQSSNFGCKIRQPGRISPQAAARVLAVMGAQPVTYSEACLLHQHHLQVYILKQLDLWTCFGAWAVLNAPCHQGSLILSEFEREP